MLLGLLSVCVLWGCKAHEVVEEVETPHNYHDLWRTWGTDPGTIIPIALTAWLYARGLYRIWRSSGIGHGIKRWQAWCFAGGWFALVVALISPLHPWGQVLFSPHMAQHEVLMLIAAPLIVLGRPMAVFLAALPRAWAKNLAAFGNSNSWLRFWRFIAHPFSAWTIHFIALWIWHLPAMFEATLHSEFVHAMQHLSFLLSALLFWWAVVHGQHRRLGYGMAVLYMFTTALHSGLLGAMLTFADVSWYPTYARTAREWGLTVLEDQQLGGLIMWVPAGLVYIVAGLALFTAWLREAERRAVAHDEKPFAGEVACDATASS